MDNDEIERELVRSRRRRWPWVVLAVVLLLAAVLGVMRYTLHHRVQKKLASLRAAGYPTTLAELDAWYPTPTGPNAADVYQLAFDAYVADEELEELLLDFGREAEFPAPGEPLPADMVAAMEAYVALNAQTLSLVADAAAIPECRFPVDFTQGLDAILDLPHLAELRTCTRLLGLRATIEANSGQRDRAASSIKTMLRVADSLRGEPTTISYLVRLSIESRGCRTVERLLGEAQWTGEQLADLSRAFAGTIDERALPRAVAGERAIGLGAGTQLLSQARSLGSLARAVGVADADRLAYLRIMDESMAMVADPLGYTGDIDAMVKDTPWYCLVARTLPPSIDRVIDSRQYADAETQMVLVGLAAKRYQLGHNRLPTSLDELVPDFLDAVPADPLDGKPLRCKSTDAGMILYSVGKDGIDDGGKELDAQGRRFSAPENHDIVLTVSR